MKYAPLFVTAVLIVTGLVYGANKSTPTATTFPDNAPTFTDEYKSVTVPAVKTALCKGVDPIPQTALAGTCGGRLDVYKSLQVLLGGRDDGP